MQCDGNCDETHRCHSGEVRRVVVFGWGKFNYCDNAVEEDISRGLTVVERFYYFTDEFDVPDMKDECPVCGAGVGDCCSEPDSEDPSLGVEFSTKIHAERLTTQ